MRRRTATNRRLLDLPQHFTAPAADFRRDWLGTLRRIRYSRLQSISSGTQCSRRYRALFPQMTMIRRVGLGVATALIAIAGAFSLPAQAARVGVLSNRYFAETAATFTSNVAGHTFTGVDVSTTTPTLASLQSSFDVVLLFEDGRFPNAPSVGNVGIAPDYPQVGPGNFGGDFYTVWKNAFDFGARNCQLASTPAFPIPTLSAGALALTALLLVAVAIASRR